MEKLVDVLVVRHVVLETPCVCKTSSRFRLGVVFFVLCCVVLFCFVLFGSARERESERARDRYFQTQTQKTKGHVTGTNHTNTMKLEAPKPGSFIKTPVNNPCTESNVRHARTNRRTGGSLVSFHFVKLVLSSVCVTSSRLVAS